MYTVPYIYVPPTNMVSSWQMSAESVACMTEKVQTRKVLSTSEKLTEGICLDKGHYA